ncbi:MAG: FAD-binding oxidoreductase [Alphaproteobacteria bacterium]|nr:FAD-binding oxidoreductase [Alphaproteobacteria bacterium]
MTEPPLQRSLWAATASPSPPCPPLAGEVEADVAIVGAGYTGLSAALRLAEAGARAAVLEAHEPGWGASGRNGGQVIAGLKHDPDELLALYGAEAGRQALDCSAAAADLVFELIERHAIACDAQRQGWIQAAHRTGSLAPLRRRYQQLAALGHPVEWLEADQARALIGLPGYVGGWLDRRGGVVQPLSYARGLARAALTKSATVHAGSPATRLARQDGRWRVETPAGAVRAATVLLTSNGYTDDLWPGLRQSVIPVYSVQVATQPLGHNLARGLLPSGQAVSDTHRLLWYFRKDAAGRLVMGGGGSAYARDLPRLAAGLRRRVQGLSPELAEVPFAFAWGGRVALTRDHLPHLSELAPGLWAGLGYNGRGVAMATMLGHVLADRALGSVRPRFVFPATPLRRIPLHGLRGLAVSGMRAYYRLRDRLER